MELCRFCATGNIIVRVRGNGVTLTRLSLSGFFFALVEKKRKVFIKACSQQNLRLEEAIDVVSEPSQYKSVYEIGGKAPCILSVDLRLRLRISFISCTLKPLLKDNCTYL